MPTIESLKAREILNSRAQPTLEVEITLSCGTTAIASTPSGASKGKFEATELRDNEPRYNGQGTRNSVALVSGEIADLICGFEALDQRAIDSALCSLDKTHLTEQKTTTPNPKQYLGAQATLGVSLSVAKAAARSIGLPLYQYLGGCNAHVLPIPFLNILNGGAHTHTPLEVQEFMLVPFGAPNFSEALRMGAETYLALKTILIQKGYACGLGDEGGFAPELTSTRAALDLLMEAIARVGLQAGKEIGLALDIASSSLYEEGYYKLEGKKLTSAALCEFLRDLRSDYPIVSIEDGLSEEDWQGWQDLTRRFAEERLLLVGDDLFASNLSRLRRGIVEGCGNSLLLKANQVGTLSEAWDCATEALSSGFSVIASHRSGETEEDSLSDIAVALNCGLIKAGAPARSERVAKYNRLLRIEEALGSEARYGCISGGALPFSGE